MDLIVATSTAKWFLPVIAGAALADSINPCAFSVLFLTIAFLFSLSRSRRYILLAGGLYIAGIAIVYMLIGVGILEVLSFLNIPNVMAKVGAVILIAYSVIALLGELFPAFPIRLKMPSAGHGILGRLIQQGTLPLSFVLGVAVGLFEFPCTGGPYLFVLSLLHDQATFWQGFGYLVIYDIIFVLPLVVILLAASTRALLDKVERIRRTETHKGRIVLDIALFAVGVILLII
ncbi:MAG: cytochrome c biogenesis protein CcdA [Candidatus Paceibacterota bacterium]|jgi:cytochrome c biogenesis protein CcdA